MGARDGPRFTHAAERNPSKPLAPRMFRGRRSGAGRTLRGRHGVPGPVPAAASSFLAVRSGAEACAQDRGCGRRLPPPGGATLRAASPAPQDRAAERPPRNTQPVRVFALEEPRGGLATSIFLPQSSGDVPRSGFKCPSLPLTSTGEEDVSPMLSPGRDVQDPSGSLVPHGVQLLLLSGTGSENTSFFSPITLFEALWWVMLAGM